METRVDELLLMFGLSREELRRIDEIERMAKEGREAGAKATAELAAHTAVCTERHSNITKRLNDIDNTLRSVNGKGWMVLLGIVGAILLGIAEHKGLF